MTSKAIDASVSEIDEKSLIAYLKESAEIIKKSWKRQLKSKDVDVPTDFTEALKSSADADKLFMSFPMAIKKNI